MYCEKCGVKTIDGMNICEQCAFAAEWRKKSGIDKYVERTYSVPQEIKRFNLGAFMFSWIWAFAHRLWKIGAFYFLMLVVLPTIFEILAGVGYIEIGAFLFIYIVLMIAGLAFSIYLGIVGNEAAWKSRRHDNVQKFLRAQRIWSIVGIVSLCVFTIIYCFNLWLD
jgi:hypothetical protein